MGNSRRARNAGQATKMRWKPIAAARRQLLEPLFLKVPPKAFRSRKALAVALADFLINEEWWVIYELIPDWKKLRSRMIKIR